ncbi:hypothetical protein OSB04_011923 [Centaurea solstitialis]|uniref:Uncharacterized protein n=1 Tax=Centaurea solstitialis TaxID=347529 RepID=A0AA38TAD5_9ASTR|nr:hypothetical protein OSB04_011923 [Centaurea solstitialis]
MASHKGGPTLPWSWLPYINHSQPSRSNSLIKPHHRFQATTDGPPLPTTNPLLLVPTNIISLPSQPSAPQQLVAKYTIEQESSPVVSKDTQFGVGATSRTISRTPTPTSPSSKNYALQNRRASVMEKSVADPLQKGRSVADPSLMVCHRRSRGRYFQRRLTATDQQRTSLATDQRRIRISGGSPTDLDCDGSATDNNSDESAAKYQRWILLATD